ncbi:hypothetical protein BOTCAL_0431g00020 [Botryotinia calthae]|uniref:Uncharacterized protein n=1 Tax=Botryotinia calthae TaxID=38488 RepID=A0A4Y8CNY5_9HELO|nr:hypothetical protein BOTCAL_0431g00020 [Botryotinia calthae]
MSEEENDDDLFDFDAITDSENDEWEDEVDECGEEEEEEGEEEEEEYSDMEMNVDDCDEGVVRQLEEEMGLVISDEWKERFDNGIWARVPNISIITSKCILLAIAWIHNLPRWKDYWGKAYDRFEATMQILTTSAPSSLGCDWVVHQGARSQQHKYNTKRHGFWQAKQAIIQRSKNAWNLLFFPKEKEESEELCNNNNSSSSSSSKSVSGDLETDSNAVHAEDAVANLNLRGLSENTWIKSVAKLHNYMRLVEIHSCLHREKYVAVGDTRLAN